MPADKQLCGRVHGRGVERARNAPGAHLIEGEVGAASDEAVEIMPPDRRETGVEVAGDALRAEHRDRMRAHMRIQCVAHGVAVPIPGEIDMGDLAERMHARIGAPGTGDDRPLAGKCQDGIGDDALHRDAVVLHLPADKWRAVILDGELVAGHD